LETPRPPESPGIAFLWFIAVIRNLISDREDRFFATVFLGSGLLFVAMLFIAAGVGASLMVAVKFHDEPVPSPDTVATIRSLAPLPRGDNAVDAVAVGVHGVGGFLRGLLIGVVRAGRGCVRDRRVGWRGRRPHREGHEQPEQSVLDRHELSFRSLSTPQRSASSGGPGPGTSCSATSAGGRSQRAAQKPDRA
jgi:hypothetical protein